MSDIKKPSTEATPGDGAATGADSAAVDEASTDQSQRPFSTRVLLTLMRIAFYLLVIVIGWGLLVWFGQRPWMVYPMRDIAVAATEEPLSGAERWERPSGTPEVDGGDAWFVPAEGASAENPGPAVLLAHGNVESIDGAVGRLDREPPTYAELGVSVLIPEFRGYGRASGKPSREAILEDYKKYYEQLRAREDVDPDRIILHGRSLGAGVIADLTRELMREGKPLPAGLIIESSFTSMVDYAWQYYWVPSFLVRDPYDVAACLQTYGRPVLILHGANDGVIPPSHARRLHALAADSTLKLYPETDHNDEPPIYDYWVDIRDFLEHEGLVQARTPPPSDGPATQSDNANTQHDDAGLQSVE